MYIEDETPEDRTARMLRRIPIAELEAKADKLNLFTIHNTDLTMDRDFLYEHGYTIAEYFDEAFKWSSFTNVNKIFRVLYLQCPRENPPINKGCSIKRKY